MTASTLHGVPTPDVLHRTQALAQRRKRMAAFFVAGVLVCFTGAAAAFGGALAGTVHPGMVALFGFTGAGSAALTCLNLCGWRESVGQLEAMRLAEALLSRTVAWQSNPEPRRGA